MQKFFVLLKKEIRELLTLQMILPLILIVAVFYFVGKVAGEESQKAQFNRGVIVMDLDKTESSRQLTALLIENGFQVQVLDGVDKDLGLIKAKQDNKRAFLFIPTSFESNLKQNSQTNIEVYYIIKNFSFSGASNADLSPVLNAVNQAFSNQIIKRAAPNLDLTKAANPLQVQNKTVVQDRTADVGIQEVNSIISSQATFIPIILMLVITFASTLIATSIASEKENKTLETLLSTPVSRNAIVSAKLAAAGLIALLSASVYLIGLNSYISGLTQNQQGTGHSINQTAIDQLGIAMTTPDYLLLGLVLFLGILVALSIALILGSLAQDTKSAQGVVSPLMVLVLIPYFLVFFIDMNNVSEGVRWLIFAIPFTHVFQAAPNIMLNQFQPVIYGIAYLVILFIIFIYIASRIFSTDKLLTIKLNFRRINKKDS
ncbi:MAG: ABC transporter permease [Candidatus Doudnabacteria bacterium]|nr:ABC transporter permease [Candidatus Doudnabacteria bacterium]